MFIVLGFNLFSSEKDIGPYVQKSRRKAIMSSNVDNTTSAISASSKSCIWMKWSNDVMISNGI